MINGLTPIGTLARQSCRITVTCANCYHASEFKLDRFVARWGPRIPLASLPGYQRKYRLFRCTRCNGRIITVSVRGPGAGNP